MSYTQLKLKPEYRDKLKALADANKRSMANQLEVLIDHWVDPMKLIAPQQWLEASPGGIIKLGGPSDGSPSIRQE